MDNKIDLADGFFDLKINEALPQFRSAQKKEYALIRETKNLFDKVVQKFVGETVPENELDLATALLALNKLFQSAVILFERGLLESGNIISRSCIELSFKIVELTKNPTFVAEMKKAQKHEIKSTLNIIKDNQLYHLVPKETVDDLLRKLNSEKAKSKISIVDLAKKNDLLQEYIIYRLYCNECHQSIATLKEIQLFEPDGVHLNGNLKLEDFSETIYMLISIMLISLPVLMDKYSFDNELVNQYDALIENFQHTFEKEDA